MSSLRDLLRDKPFFEKHLVNTREALLKSVRARNVHATIALVSSLTTIGGEFLNVPGYDVDDVFFVLDCIELFENELPD